MGFRVTTDTLRPEKLVFVFDGKQMSAYAGETIAAALLAGDIRAFRRDSRGAARGPYCNMGTCFECLVDVRVEPDPSAGAVTARTWRRVRACLTPVSSDLHVRSAAAVRLLDAAV